MPTHLRPVAVRRSFTALLLLAGLLLLVVPSLAAPARAQTAVDGPRIDVVEIDGIFDRVVLRHLEDQLARAERAGAVAVVVQLDSVGGLAVSAQEVRTLLDTDVPVVVWIGEPGARALGAAAVLADAADLLLAAPATLFGAPAPVDLGDVAGSAEIAAGARVRAIAELTGEAGGIVALADQAGAELPAVLPLPVDLTRDDVTVVSTDEAVAAGIVDVAAPTLPDVLAELDGRQVAGRMLDVDPTAADVRFTNLGLWDRTLHTVAMPTLAYILLVSGMLALLFELFQPGFGVAGIAGIATALLGLYGFAVLPGSWLAFAGVLVGLLLLAADLALARLGTLSILGTLLLGVGSVTLFPGPAPLTVSLWVTGLVTAFCAVFFIGIMTTVLRNQGDIALRGAEHVIGKVAVVRSMLNPEGHVFVDGALWRARAPEGAGKVRTGTPVRILGMNDRLTLEVEVVADGAAGPGQAAAATDDAEAASVS